MDKSRFFVGIDEVGRGPLAGPVAIAAVRFRVSAIKLLISKAKNKKLPLRDSKKLSKKQREEWFAILKTWQDEGECVFAVSYIHAKKIDRVGLSLAIKKAISRSIDKIQTETSHLILLDGGLKAPKEFIYQKTIIKGDEKEPIIAFASIIAKVYRDRLMARHAKKFPEYGFERHVGYGTKAHYSAIKKHGLTPLHRRSFLKKITQE